MQLEGAMREAELHLWICRELTEPGRSRARIQDPSVDARRAFNALSEQDIWEMRAAGFEPTTFGSGGRGRAPVSA